MSRSGYTDDCDGKGYGIYRGRVASAIRGKRGQRLLRDLAEAMDAMPRKRLIAGEFVAQDGEACALGVLALHRSIPDADAIDSEDHELLSEIFDVPRCLIREIENENDECSCYPTDVIERWDRMRDWVASKITDRKETQ